MTITRHTLCAVIAVLGLGAAHLQLSHAQSSESEGWHDLGDYEGITNAQKPAARQRAEQNRPARGTSSVSNNGASNDGWRDLDALTPPSSSQPSSSKPSRSSRKTRRKNDRSPKPADTGWRDLESAAFIESGNSGETVPPQPRPVSANSGWRDLEDVDTGEAVPPQQRPHWSQTQLNVWTVEDSSQSPTEGSAAYLFAGDTLDIDFKDVPTLSGAYTLSDTGTITLPLIGALRAHGQSAEAFEVVLEQIYGIDYLVDPEISISKRATVIGQITLSGLVRAPGDISVTKPENLAQILGRAGGVVGGNAAKDAVITRRKNGEVYARSVSLDQISPTGSSGLMLLPGDSVNIIERSALPDMQATSSRFPRLDNVLSGGSAINF